MGLDPTTIGRYVVLGTLGQGAMGTVYLGEDPALKRGVALKVVHGGQAEGREQALRRFRREAEISARLNHPNVITVFDVGEEPGIGPYLAMEHVEGDTLEALLRRGPLAPARALEVLIQAASALGAAHAAGIVHRDVKPANLMVSRDGRVKLMDFGIATEEDRATTTTAALLCTPGFAAPELLDGARASAVTDRWAFAVTAYECLHGKPPFDGDSLSVVLYNVAHGAPSFPDSLEPALQAVFRRALAKAPGDRHPDLRAFLADLVEALPLEEPARRRFRSHLAGTAEVSGRTRASEPAGPQAAPLRSAPPPARTRLLVWGGGSLAVAGLAFLGWWQGLLLPRRLRVESTPSGAWVMVGTEPQGRTPLQDLWLPQRTGKIRLELDGYYPELLQIGDGGGAFHIRLRPRHLFLDLDSRPTDAEVYVNGTPVGRTPLRGLKVPNQPLGVLLLVRRDGAGSWAAVVSDQNLPPAVVPLTSAKGPR